MANAVRCLKIEFDDSHAKYQEGEEVTGRVVVELREDIVIESLCIEFCGSATVDFTKASSEAVRARSSQQAEEKYLNQTLLLYRREDDSKKMLVSAGSHRYDFRIQLPLNIPSSINANYGFVRYNASTVLERPWYLRETVTKEFFVTSIVDLNLIPQTQKSLTCHKSQEVGMFCCLPGHMTVDWCLDRMGYLCGETISIKGEICNESGTRIKKSTASLLQHLRYYDGLGNSVHERKKVAVIEKDEILSGSTQTWQEEMEIPDLPPTGLKSCNLMDLNYTLLLKVSPAGLTENLESECDIVIATIPYEASDSNIFTGFSPSFSSPLVAYADSKHAETPLDLNYFI